MRAMVAMGALLVCAPARADLPVEQPREKSYLLEDELISHAPPPAPPKREAREEPKANARAKTAESDSPVRVEKFEHDTCDSSRPLEFVDTTLESEDLVSRFRSSKPVVKHAPAPTKPRPPRAQRGDR